MRANSGSTAVVAVIGALLLSTAAIAAENPKMDRYGDPLPPGAISRMGTCRLHAPEAITDAAFSRDGKTLVTAGHCVCFWDTPPAPC